MSFAPPLFMGILLGGPVSLGAWFFRAFLPGLTGNPVGGVLSVTPLGIDQARTLREQGPAPEGRRGRLTPSDRASLS